MASERATVDDETVKASNLTTTQPMSKESTATQVGPLTFDPSPQLEDDEQHVHAASDKQAELMRWTYCLGHLAFSKLKQLALKNKIPKQLTKVKPPVCASCLFGAMTRVPWQGKEGSSEHTVFTATKPGEIVSVDQLISTQVGFIAQLKGRLTKQRYTAATVFTDHYFCLQYVHLMTQITSQETVEAKQAFEIFAKQHAVCILHNHCNNGRFANNAFKQQACESARQCLTFCGVNAHFQKWVCREGHS